MVKKEQRRRPHTQWVWFALAMGGGKEREKRDEAGLEGLVSVGDGGGGGNMKEEKVKG